VGTSTTTTTTTTVRKQNLKSKRSQEIDERKNEGIVKSRAHGRKQEETKRLYSKIKIKTKKTNKKANLLCPLKKKTNTKYAIKLDSPPLLVIYHLYLTSIDYTK